MPYEIDYTDKSGRQSPNAVVKVSRTDIRDNLAVLDVWLYHDMALKMSGAAAMNPTVISVKAIDHKDYTEMHKQAVLDDNDDPVLDDNDNVVEEDVEVLIETDKNFTDYFSDEVLAQPGMTPKKAAYLFLTSGRRDAQCGLDMSNAKNVSSHDVDPDVGIDEEDNEQED